MTSATPDLAILLAWGPPKRVHTKNGPRDLHVAEPTEQFWKLWNDKNSQSALRAGGISLGKAWKDPGKWEVCWWKNLPPAEVARLKDNVEASQKADASLVIPKPDNGMDFWPYQRAGVSYSVRDGDAPVRVLLGDEMGLGKTIQAIGIINLIQTIGCGLVICPASVKRNWKRECDAWMSRKFDIWPASAKAWPHMADFVILNYDILGKHTQELTSRQWDIVIVDECHMLRNTKTQRWKNFQAIQCRHKVALTGTPILNQLEDIWPILHWLAPQEYGTIFSFRRKFVEAPGGRQKLQLRLREQFMIRRLKKDVLKELPARRRQIVEVEDTVGAVDAESQALTANDQAEELIASLEAALEVAKVSDNQADYERALEALEQAQRIPFESIARVRHETALRKVPLTIEHLKNCFESGLEKIVVFAHHRDCIEGIAGAFPGSVILYGGMTEQAKDDSITRFMTDPNCHLWCGSIRAGGMGINGLQKVCAHGVFHELDWVPALMDQAEARLHRIGQDDSVLFQHLVIAGSIDANLASKCVEKQRMADEALDKDRDRLLQVQVSPTRARVNVNNVTLTEREMEVQSVDPGQKAAITAGLRILAGVCDGARTWDDVGFNKVDAHIGKRLATVPGLSDRQAMLGKKLCNKYRRQLDEDLLQKMGLSKETKPQTKAK